MVSDKLKYKLLIIDKSDLALDNMLASHLAGEGFSIVTYSNYLKALSALNRLGPNLIVLGEGLPVDSFEVCSQLRRMVEEPILMLGSVPRSAGWVRAVESGADCYLVKPFYSKELVARIRAIRRRGDWTLMAR